MNYRLRSNTVLALAVTVAIAAAVLTPAARGMTVTKSLSPGQVTVGGYVLGQNFYNASPPTSVSFGPTSAYRSTAYAGTQVITATYNVYIWSKAYGWLLFDSRRFSSTVPSGYYAPFSGATVPVNNGQKYSVDVRIDWQTTGGTRIGSAIFDYNATADYRCSSYNFQSSMCRVFDDHDGWGAYLSFA